MAAAVIAAKRNNEAASRNKLEPRRSLDSEFNLQGTRPNAPVSQLSIRALGEHAIGKKSHDTINNKEQSSLRARLSIYEDQFESQREQMSTILDHNAENRRIYEQCSGMHTQQVKKIMRSVCFKEGSAAHFFSCTEYFIPALFVGFREYLQEMQGAQGELAVYGALFMTLYVPAILGGFSPSQLQNTNNPLSNMRSSFFFGYVISIVCHVCNIAISIGLRLAASTLARDSDRLVFLWKARYIGWFSMSFFVLGTFFGCLFALGAGSTYLLSGDSCTDGSIRFSQWYDEWLQDKYPTGYGVVWPKGEAIMNPWAVMATNLSISRNDKDAPKAFSEFMHSYLELSGTGCVGPVRSQRF